MIQKHLFITFCSPLSSINSVIQCALAEHELAKSPDSMYTFLVRASKLCNMRMEVLNARKNQPWYKLLMELVEKIAFDRFNDFILMFYFILTDMQSYEQLR